MCGIVGIIGTPHASKETYQGLLLIQHRGQDATGILSYDYNKQTFNLHKNLGLVNTVFNDDDIEQLEGHTAIGHTRYSTVGECKKSDVQPSMLTYPGIGIAHNGNLVNYYEMADYLKEERQRYTQGQCDIEIIMNLLADKLVENRNEFSFDSLKMACQHLFVHAKGGYSVVGQIADKGMFVFRDPYGIRPLTFGDRDLTKEEMEKSPLGMEKSYCFSSESNVLHSLGYELVRDLKPGELIFIDKNGKFHSEIINSQGHYPCMFEWVYFANPDSIMEGKSVYRVRHRLGEQLARKVQVLLDENEIEPDIVVPVPETSRISAISLSEKLAIPYREALVKNRYVQRSFILGSEQSRNRAVKLKLAAIEDELKGKKVLLVDDSIVRGTTSRRIIEMIRKAGAKEVYLASTCPQIKYPCFYGIDFSDKNELIANNVETSSIEEKIGADKVIYTDIQELHTAIDIPEICCACLDGEYPCKFKRSEAENFQRNRNNSFKKVAHEHKQF